jgi:SIR2-like domain
MERRMSAHEADDYHYWLVASRILRGGVVPFLGAGANLCGRPEGEPWARGRYMPSGSELADDLARQSRYPASGDLELPRVSQFVDAVLGAGVLYEFLRETFDADYPPTALHRLLAEVPEWLRRREKPPLCVLTTNYDDALERALRERGEEYELLWYEAKDVQGCGHFIHRRADELVTIERPNEYDGLAETDRTVIVKLHGAIDRVDANGDSYVITEDNYIDYLSRSERAGEIPVTISDRMGASHFLFLGYSMRDWNLRVILQRIWGPRVLDIKSWAIQRQHPDPKVNDIERKLWTDRGDVDLIYESLDEYVPRLRAAIIAQLGNDGNAP